jgi:type II secretory pathway pseudopilin PulG
MMGRNRNGQLLAEVMIAVTIASLVLVGILQASSKSVGNSGYAKRQAQASAYTDRAIQLVKNMRQTGWDSLPAAGTYCFNGTSISGSAICAIDAEFNGWVTVTDFGIPLRKNVAAYVSWIEGVGSNAKAYSAKKEAVLYRY